MQIKHLIVVFFVVLIVADHCHAFIGAIGSLLGGALSKIFGRRKRDLIAQLQQYRNLQKRDAEFKEFFNNLPIY
uniref:Antimicrobial peptide n=1 Tax=Centruroides hentzi TaxID=88313 RepID=A0A2I9LNR6_9SCOR